MAETKIIYHIDEEETPYLVKLTIPPDQVTLADFKNVLNRPNYKFFFKSMDDDFGWVFIITFDLILTHRLLIFSWIYSVVKEEIVDDDAHLPCFNGRVISWVSIKKKPVSINQQLCNSLTCLSSWYLLKAAYLILFLNVLKVLSLLKEDNSSKYTKSYLSLERQHLIIFKLCSPVLSTTGA